MHHTWLNTSRTKKKTITLSKNALIYESVLYYILYLYPALYRFAGQDKINILLVSIGLDSCVCHFVVFFLRKAYKHISIAVTLQQQEH